jgi:tRNA 2-thiouridine synthesizing protein A
MSATTNRKVLDCRGSFCPGPITELFKAYRASTIGDEIEVWATDPAARSDITAWAAKSGNEVMEVAQEKDFLKIVVRVTKKGR